MKKKVTISRLVAQPVSEDGNFPLRISDLKSFVNIPWSIPFYWTAESKKVMPLVLSEMNDLNPDRTPWKLKFPGANPFFHHCSFLQYYLASVDGKPAGRIAAFIDRTYHDRSVNGPVGWVGLFESIENQDVAEMLLAAAMEDLKEHGAVKIIGPARFNANGEDGVLVAGFDKHPMLMEPYQPPYYAQYLGRWGIKENDWYAFRMNHQGAMSYMERIERMRRNGLDLEQRLAQDGITVRTAQLKNWDNEIARIKMVYNQAWDTADHPQFEKFTDEEFDYLAAGLKLIAIEDLVFIAEDTSAPGKPVIGMAVTLPDLNEVIEDYDRLHPLYVPSFHTYGLSDLRRDLGILRLLRRRIKTRQFRNARTFILGTLQKKTGLDALLYLKTFLATESMGIETTSGSQIADTNPEMVNPLSKMGDAEITWRIYQFDEENLLGMLKSQTGEPLPQS